MLGHLHVAAVTVCGSLRLVIKEQHVALWGAWRRWQLPGISNLELGERSRGTGREGARPWAQDHIPARLQTRRRGWSAVERPQARLEGHRLWSRGPDSRLSHLSASDFGQAA